MIDVLSKVAEICGNFDGFPTNTPSKTVPDGVIVGNGDVGVSIGGKDECVQLYISKNDFWYAATGRKGGGIKPFGYLQISVADDPKNVSFKAKQKILHAEADVELSFCSSGDDERLLAVHSYVIRQENIIVTEVTCKKGDPRIKIDLVPIPDMYANFSHNVCGGSVAVSKSYENAESPWNTYAYGESLICGKDSNLLRISEGETVRIITAIATNHDTHDYEDTVKRMLGRDFDATLPSMWKKHIEWWDEFWKSSAVDIPDLPHLEKYWYASHYIIACCSEKGKVAPGLFGNWITDEAPSWAGDYHLNYNYEAPWWGAYSSNKIGLTEPYDRPLLDCIPAMKENARSILGCNGLYSLVGIGPYGLEVTISYFKDGTRSFGTGFWGQRSNASYAAVNMVMRFYTTYDKEYALSCAYPFLREAALFWEDYLKFEDGRYVIYNDCINENVYEAIGIYDWATPDSRDTGDDFNPIISLGLIRLVMKALIDICEYTETEDDHLEKWEHILKHISDFPTQIRNGEKVFRLTERGEDWNDRNSLIVQHIYPCGAIGLSSDSEILETARRTVRQADRFGPDFNAFPTFYPAAVRVGYDPDTVLDGLQKQIKEHSYNNFFIFYGGGGIECCSTVPNCINEMLFQSHEGVLQFFPVWKRELDARFENLRGYGAFLVSAEQKDGVVGQITLYSEKGRDCTVLCPWECGMTVTCQGETVACEVKAERGQVIYTFATEAGRTYMLSAINE